MKQMIRHTWILALAATFSFGGLIGCKKKAATPAPNKAETRTPAKTKADAKTPARRAAVAANVKVKDLVCGMTVMTADVKHTHKHDGKTYHFCNAGCLKAFKANPTKYLAKADPKKADPAKK